MVDQRKQDYAEWPAERKHHRFSPSTLQNREVCPCYESSGEANEAAIEGTLAHGVVETGKDDSRMSDGHAAMAAECLDFVEERRSYVSSRTGMKELKEVYLSVDDIDTTAGYVDEVLRAVGYAEMIDWKFGKWPVEPPENNLQCISYTLGLFREYPDVNTIRFFFKQPALNLTRDAVFTRDQIPDLYLRVRTVVARARAAIIGDVDNPTDYRWEMANPMVPVCNFCSNIGRCPKVAALVCKVGSKFHPLEIPAEITPTMVLNGEDTNLGLRLAQVVKIWADGFRRCATNRILEGIVPVPEGHMLVSQTRRIIADETQFEHVALQYLSREEWNDTKKILFGAVEKAIMNKAERGHKKETVEKFSEHLASAGATKESEPYTFLKATPVKEKSTQTTNT